MNLIRRIKTLLRITGTKPEDSDAAAGDGSSPDHAQTASDVGPDVAENFRLRGNMALEQGRLDVALDFYQRFAALEPDRATAHLNVGYTLFSMQRHQEAEVALQRSLQLDAKSHEAHYFLGCAKAERGDMDGATASLSLAVALLPEFDAGWIQLGIFRERQGALGQARQCYRRAVTIQPAATDGWEGLTRTALAARQNAEALEAADRWLALDSRSSTAYGMRADALRRLYRKREALVAAQAAIALRTDDPMLWQVLGWARNDTGRFDDAMEAFQRALALSPLTEGNMSGLGVALCGLKRPEEALPVFEELARIAPSHEDLSHNQALCLIQSLRMADAVKILCDAIDRTPDDAQLHFDLAIAQLTLGQYETGWLEYEWRLSLKKAGRVQDRAPLPLWPSGTSVNGKRIFITSEQGLGDSIQFIRYVPHLLAEGARVTLQVSPRVRSLVEGIWEGCEVTTQAAGSSASFELQCSLMSLPHVTGIAAPLPAAFPYVRADSSRRDHWKKRIGETNELTVGLVWAGNPDHPDDAKRSIPLELFRTLAPKNIKFVSLQFDIRDSDIAAKNAWPDLLHFGAEQRDLADTAALIESLDAMVCVDTSIAHLSGALCIPVFILLQYCPDWRWQLYREDTPWYPSARLIRQDASRQWQPVIQRAMALLGNLEKFNAHDNDSAGTSRATPSAEVMPPVP